MDLEIFENYLKNNGISEEVIDFSYWATGYNYEALTDILYYKFGYHDFNQLDYFNEDEEDEENE